MIQSNEHKLKRFATPFNRPQYTVIVYLFYSSCGDAAPLTPNKSEQRFQGSHPLNLKCGFMLNVHIRSFSPLRQSCVLLDCSLIQLNFDLTEFSIWQSFLVCFSLLPLWVLSALFSLMSLWKRNIELAICCF